jgi:hypothetical protein
MLINIRGGLNVSLADLDALIHYHVLRKGVLLVQLRITVVLLLLEVNAFLELSTAEVALKELTLFGILALDVFS